MRIIREKSNMLKNVSIDELPTVIYDCFAHQIMIICKHHFGEFWKLFLEDEIILREREGGKGQLWKQMVIERDYSNAMKKYYGISLQEMKNAKFSFKEKEIYLLSMDAEKYPLYESSFNNQLDHSFLVYGEQDIYYVVNDNYYRRSEFYMEKEYVHKYVKKKYRINKGSKLCNEIDASFKKIFRECLCDKWKIITKSIVGVENVDAIDILEMLKSMSDYIYSNSMILNNYVPDDFYMDECANMLRECAFKITTVYYSVLKEYIKYEVIRDDFLEKKFALISNYLNMEKRIKQQINKHFSKKVTYIDCVKQQIEEFLERKIDLGKLVCEDEIDQYLLVALISYLEMKNNITDMDMTSFETNITYQELIKMVCRYKLSF